MIYLTYLSQGEKLQDVYIFLMLCCVSVLFKMGWNHDKSSYSYIPKQSYEKHSTLKISSATVHDNRELQSDIDTNVCTLIWWKQGFLKSREERASTREREIMQVVSSCLVSKVFSEAWKNNILQASSLHREVNI